MGYETYFKLDVEPINNEVVIKLEDDENCLRELWISGQTLKWYGFEKQIKEFSKRFPKHLFILKGWGENRGDTWIHYFKNGKSQRCQGYICYEPYDEEKLI